MYTTVDGDNTREDSAFERVQMIVMQCPISLDDYGDGVQVSVVLVPFAFYSTLKPSLLTAASLAITAEMSAFFASHRDDELVELSD